MRERANEAQVALHLSTSVMAIGYCVKTGEIHMSDPADHIERKRS